MVCLSRPSLPNSVARSPALVKLGEAAERHIQRQHFFAFLIGQKRFDIVQRDVCFTAAAFVAQLVANAAAVDSSSRLNIQTR